MSPFLQIRRMLGGLWVLDGALQLQPSMFTSAFYHAVLVPAGQGQPFWLAELMAWGDHLWTRHLAVADLAAASLQMGIGLVLIGGSGWRVRVGLWLSAAWALAVWIFGEGLGGLLVPGGTVITGTPGSALFYLAFSLLLLFPDRWPSPGLDRLLRRGLGGFWLGAAGLEIVGPFWHKPVLAEMIRNEAAAPQPSVMSHLLYAAARDLTAHPALWNGGLALFMLVLAVGWLRPRPPSWPWLGANLFWLLVLWGVGMDFGVLGGTGTDPNSAPLWMLWSWAAYRHGRDYGKTFPAVFGARSTKPLSGGLMGSLPKIH